MYRHVYVDISVYIYVYGVHVIACVFYFQNLSFNILLLFITFTLFLNTECKLLIMCKGEVSISDSLLLPPFYDQVVK